MDTPLVDHMLHATVAAAKGRRTRYAEVINVCQLALQELAKLREENAKCHSG
jgi:NAD+--asparagine ADP-ribosyltransferase